MSAPLKTARIVGNLSAKLATWAHVFSPQDDEKKLQRGEFLALLSLKGLTVKNEEEAASLGKEAVTRLHEEYFGNLDKSPFEALSRAVEKIAIEVNSEQEVDLVAAALVGETLYLASNAAAKVFLLRGEHLGLVLEGPGASSGFVESGDLFCLGTSDFFKLASKQALQKALVNDDPVASVERLAPLIHALPTDEEKEATGGAGLIVAQVPVSDSKQESRPVSFSEPEFVQKKLSRKLPWEKLDPVREKLAALWEKLPIPFLKQVEKTEKHFRFRLGLALGLVVLIILLALFGRQKGKQTGDLTQVKTLFSQAQEKKVEGEALATLNPLKAKELLLESQELFWEAEKLAGGNDSGLGQFKKELEKVLGQVLKGFEVEGELFYDLGMIKSEASVSQVQLKEDQLIVLDRNKQAVYQLGTEKKRSQVLAGGDFIGQTTLLGVDDNSNPWLFTESQVFKGNVEQAGFDDSWQELKGVASFGGFFYLVDGKADEIWKVPISTAGLGSAQAWLSDEVDLAKTKKILIDGSVWLLLDQNQILKFTRGAQEVFRITGLNEPLGEVADFYLDEESENLYLLDIGKGKIVVLQKDGEFIKEYLWENLKEANQLVVQEDQDRLLVASNGKIYSLELK